VPRQLQRDDLLTVAEFLLADFEDAEGGDADWLACEDARARSAVSRAYYAGFLWLKEALIEERPQWKLNRRDFPREAVHRNVLAALDKGLGPAHELIQPWKLLLRNRRQADYEWRTSFDRKEAERLLDHARDTLTRIDALNSEQKRKVAGWLADLTDGP
jgi:hypothetical protein